MRNGVNQRRGGNIAGAQTINERGQQTSKLLSRHNLSVLTLLAGLTACGGGADQKSLESTEVNTPRMKALAVETGSTAAPAIVELGPISGANVIIKSAITGQALTGILRTRADGTLDYNASDILSKTPGELFLVAEVWGGQDTDANDDGIPDAVSTPVNGSFQQIVPRTALTLNKPLVINPRAGMITEMIFNRGIPFSRDILDHMTRESGAQDANADGIVTYDDVNYVQMKNATGVSAVMPSISGWISSIHSGDNTAKVKSLKEIAKAENHIMKNIIPNPSNPLSHDPSLRLRTMKSGTTILYTLDGSTPMPGQAGTLSAISEVVLPLQDKELYYREAFTLGGETVLGKVNRFHLMTDWIEESQARRAFDATTRETIVPETFTYKGISYSFETKAYTFSPGYPYPKTIDCTIHTTPVKAGCQYGPYEAYTAEHETRIREIVDMEVKKYIDSINVITTPENSLEIVRNNVSYRNNYYSLYNFWTIDPVSKKRTFPVSIQARFYSLKGAWNQVDFIAQNEAQRVAYNTEAETIIKKRIELDEGVGGPVTHIQNDLVLVSRNDIYAGGWYELWNNWNPLGDSDFPVTLIGSFSTLTGGRQQNITDVATNEADRVTKGNAIIAQMRAALDASYNTAPKPTYAKNQRIDAQWADYRGYRYRTVTLMNTTGYTDYPASVYAEYTLADGTRTTVSLPVKNASELATVQAERATNARALMDIALGVDIFSPGQVILWNDVVYGTGSFKTTVTYSSTAGLDYPAYIDVNYRVSTGATGKITVQVANASERNLLAIQAETEAKRIIDNTPLLGVNQITKDGPFTYGPLSGNYTVFAKYNRVGTNNNYPALIWIEYRKSPTSPLLTTQTTYGTMIANNSQEKAAIRTTLENFVKGQIVATAPMTLDTRMAMSKRIQGLLPIGEAQAGLSPSTTIWTPQQNPIKVLTQGPVTSFLGGYTNQKLTGANGVQSIVTAKGTNTNNVSGKTIDETKLALAISEIQASAMKIQQYRLECSGVGTTNTGRMEIDCNRHYENIRIEENKIYTEIGNYLSFGDSLSFGRGLTVGAGRAIYDQILGVGSDVAALADGTLIKEFRANLQGLKQKIQPYIVNGVFDLEKAKSDFFNGTSAFESEVKALLLKLPGAYDALDAYNKGYFMGAIGGGMALEMVDPIKKLKIVLRGYTYAAWLYPARYLVDSIDAGHNQAQIIENMKKLDRVKWSRVDKPDMSKITNTTLYNIVRDQYKVSSTIGNGSSADALRYEKATGILLSQSGHQTKNTEVRDSLQGRLNNGEFTGYDLMVAKDVVTDLTNSLNGK